MRAPPHEKGSLQRIERDAILSHALFAIVCLSVLLAPVDAAVGIRLLLLVLIYNVMVPVWGYFRGYGEWVDIWQFVLILSMLQVFPDWFLAQVLDVLVFPEDGCFRIGAVSGYMAGLWSIPLFMICFLGERLRLRAGLQSAYIGVALAAFVVFAGSEQTLWLLSWYARNVTMIGHVAVYILIPEVLLGISAYYAYTQTRMRPLWFKIAAAFLVMQFYLGSAAFFYFLIERVLPGA